MLKELTEKRAKLLAELKGDVTAERFAEIRSEIERLNFAIEEAKKDEHAEEERKAAEQKKAEEERAARTPNGGAVDLFNGKKVNEEENRAKVNEELEKRAKALKNGENIKLENRSVAISSTATGTVASDEINPAFEQVGTLDKLVNVTDLSGSGAESYKKPFAKAIGEGGITAEGNNYTDAEPTFGYADINKIKITAYAEVTEEVEKLPAADYVKMVEGAVKDALRKKEIGQIIGGTGSGEFVGILNAGTDIIDANQTKTIATIDENTLDNVIFDYGGDEDVEGDATFILNKLTLKEFAKVKGSDKKRAYDIVVKGNTGTINGIPFVCTSKLAAYGAVENGVPYMLYGKLKGYELTRFSDVEVAKSKDFKFKQGMISFKASEFVGGSPAMYNGFLKIIKAAAE